MSNVITIFKKRLIEKQVARQNLAASLSELPPESELAIKLTALIEKLDLWAWNINKNRRV